MSMHVPTNNGACPCKRCQAVLGLTPAQREKRRQRKIITHAVIQLGLAKGGKR